VRYRRRDTTARTISLTVLGVLVFSDVLLVAFGGGVPLGIRIALVALFVLAGLFVGLAVPPPFRLIWLAILGGFCVLALAPPSRLVPGRLLVGAILLVASIGTMLLHARRKRRALWSKDDQTPDRA